MKKEYTIDLNKDVLEQIQEIYKELENSKVTPKKGIWNRFTSIFGF